jgi:CO/xanthine dehydrogenase FAD-binding subunit
MDLYLKGTATEAEDKSARKAEPLLRFNNDYLKKASRVEMPKRPVEERNVTIEDALGLSLKEIEGEANRCFNCSCVSVNSSDIGVALIALDARVTIVGSGGMRIISAEEFFGTLGNSLNKDEMITEIQVPRLPDGAKQIFLKHRVREAVDFAIVSVASVITEKGGKCEDARIVLGAVAPVPIQASKAEDLLRGKAIDEKIAEEAGRLAVSDAIPLNLNSYKVEITKTLVKRAILS